MIRRPPIRFRLLAFWIPIVLLGGLAWCGYKTARQVRLNHALIRAIDTGQIATVRRLLDQGADPQARIETDETSLGLFDRIKALFRGSVRRDNEMSLSALGLAVDHGNVEVEIVRLLLDHGANLNVKDKDGTTILMLAVMGRHREGVPVETSDPANTALIGFLLDRGMDVNATDKDGLTALMIAAKDPDVGVVELLLDRGAEVNAKDSHGYTALIAAAFNGRAKITRLLLDRGADAKAKMATGETAMKFAADENHSNIVALLKQAGAKE